MYKLLIVYGLSEIKKKNFFYVVFLFVFLFFGFLNFKCYYLFKGIDMICMFFIFVIEYLYLIELILCL